MIEFGGGSLVISKKQLKKTTKQTSRSEKAPFENKSQRK
jgi:hypothetical protein